jgi:hypothetical protein
VCCYKNGSTLGKDLAEEGENERQRYYTGYDLVVEMSWNVRAME